MKRWNILAKAGWLVFLCLFLIEYLHPSAIGVRADYSPTKYYSFLDYKSPRSQKSERFVWVRGDHDPFADSRSTLSKEHRLEQKNIVHAMVWFFPMPVIRAFPKFKFQPIQAFLFNYPPCEEIYHPPRSPFLFLSA